MDTETMDPLFRRFVEHHAIDVDAFPAGNVSWRWHEERGTPLEGLDGSVPAFCHTRGGGGVHWQIEIRFTSGNAGTTIVANSRVVVARMCNTVLPETAIIDVAGRRLDEIVHHPMLDGLIIDSAEITDDGMTCTLLCLRQAS